jgi:hypothetical protein
MSSTGYLRLPDARDYGKLLKLKEVRRADVRDSKSNSEC